MKSILKLFIAALTLTGVAANTYAQKKPTLIKTVLTGKATAQNPRLNRIVAAKIDQAQRLRIVEQAQKFVAQTGRWMSAENSNAQEAALAQKASALILAANPLDPAVGQLKQLRSAAWQMQAEKQTLAELENFLATHQRFPRKDLRPLKGKVEKMLPAQLAEFKLAQQINLLEAKDPDSAVAQQIQSLRQLWSK